MDASVGAGMGLGYQFARDPLSGHYYLLPHPHAIPGLFLEKEMYRFQFFLLILAFILV